MVWLSGVLGLPSGLAVAGEGAGHWAFQPLDPPAIPRVRREGWARSGLDCFVLARLEAEGLQPQPAADAVTWLRRVTLDLTGLPPTPEAIGAFLADRRPDARERVVEGLLASPRHGERWAQHWLDVVRYADTHGFEVNTERPNAWPYRDYVIQAFNRDLPYDRFVWEQIAGDQSGEDAATGFLLTASVLLPGQIGADDASKRLARQDALDEIVVNIGQTFLGLSLGCARCHDHKTDPVSQRDYYAVQACVAGVEYEERDLQSAEAQRLRVEEASLRAQLTGLERRLTLRVPRAGSGRLRPAVNPRLNADRFPPIRALRVRFTVLATTALEPCLDELEVLDTEGVNVALAAGGTVATSSGDNVAPGRHELRFLHDGRPGNSSSWMSDRTGGGWVTLTLPAPSTLAAVLWGRDRLGQFSDRLATNYVIEVDAGDGSWVRVADASDRRPSPGATDTVETLEAGLDPAEAAEAGRLRIEKRDVEAALARVGSGQRAFSGRFRTPDRIRRLARGDPEQPREDVGPDIPACLGTLGLSQEAPDAERRRRLADWIASPANPLTARVLVNRVWQGHFGRGLVETPSDFGVRAPRPSHPELLDWLAWEFVRGGWSLRQLHRRIVLSATYAQSGRIDPVSQSRDVEGRWLGRFPARRLEAEAIRDTMLAVSGRLNEAMFGRGYDLFDQRGGLSGFKPVESHGEPGRRRMIYAHKVRREPEAVFGAFDCPDAGQSTARRRSSTTPLQALNLFNSRFTLEEAVAFAARVRREAGPLLVEQIHRSFLLALGRPPVPEEIREALPVVREFGLPVLGRALFNSNEFLQLP